MREATVELLRAPRCPGADGTPTPHVPSRHNGGDPLRLVPFTHAGDHVTEGILIAPDGRWWWIDGGIPRLLPPTMHRSERLEAEHAARIAHLGLRPSQAVPRRARGRLHRVQRDTIDRFGHEWLTFRDWGWQPTPPDGDALCWRGGLWENTLGAFRSKTFLRGRVAGLRLLDAGCGNGRFTAAALHEGASEVISVDIGAGVEAAYEHHRDDPRVHIVQASLFDLPLASVDGAFAIGVLMHTGDASAAFAEIARLVAPGGFFAVRMYHRGNAAYEIVDGSIRAVTTRLNKPAQMAFSRAMARFGRWLEGVDARRAARGRPAPMGLRMRCYHVLRNWPTIHHNLDWWSAPVATHHTVAEIAQWGGAAGLEVVQADPRPELNRFPFFGHPEALTVLLRRPLIAATQPDTAPCISSADAIPAGAAA